MNIFNIKISTKCKKLFIMEIISTDVVINQKIHFYVLMIPLAIRRICLLTLFAQRGRERSEF